MNSTDAGRLADRLAHHERLPVDVLAGLSELVNDGQVSAEFAALIALEQAAKNESPVWSAAAQTFATLAVAASIGALDVRALS